MSSPSLDLARDCWFLTGPTASGKSAVGVELAERLNAEIVAMDSMSLYRGMDIGTAKPSAKERAAVPHQLIDVLEPGAEFSLAQYVSAAREAVEGIAARGRTALFVGGTPLYLKGLLRGLFEGPPADWELRRRLLSEAEQRGEQHLYERLTAIDPEGARRLHARDTRRLIRAIEVFEKTGRPISDWQRQFDVPVPQDECRVFVLDWPRESLYERINRRVEEMFRTGLVAEVRGLLSRGPLSRTASQAVGYREVIEHLQSGLGLDASIASVQQHTRQLAKRQITWFRSLSECRMIEVSEPFQADEVARRVFQVGSMNDATRPVDTQQGKGTLIIADDTLIKTRSGN
jgi:tRNA dimethylallyltransferase